MVKVTPKPGQIWKENDKRFERFIEIISVEGDHVFFKNHPVEKRPNIPRKAMLKRFNGRNMGYSLYKDVK